MSEYVTPRVDIAFKKLFGVEENKDLLISLINSIVSEEDQVIDIHLLNPYNPKNFRDDKLSILDIKAKSHTGKLYNIEMQISDDGDYNKRALFYWARCYVDQLSEGVDYEELQKTIGIHILNFISVPAIDHYHNVFHVHDVRTKTHYFKDFEMHTIELCKFEQEQDNNPTFGESEQLKILLQKVKTSLDRWVAFLTRHDLLSKKPLPPELKDPKIQKALEVLKVMNFSLQEREAYEAHLKWLRVECSTLKKAEKKGEQRGLKKGIKKGLVLGEKQGIEKGIVLGEQQGLEKGIALGEQQGIKKVVETMLSQGTDIEIIAKFTGLKEDFIESFRIVNSPEL